MMVRMLMQTGLPLYALASPRAATTAARSLDPSSTSMTCHPVARSLAEVSSVKQLSIGPSTVTLLLS